MPVLLSEYPGWDELCKLSLLKRSGTVATPRRLRRVEFADSKGKATRYWTLIKATVLRVAFVLNQICLPKAILLPRNKTNKAVLTKYRYQNGRNVARSDAFFVRASTL